MLLSSQQPHTLGHIYAGEACHSDVRACAADHHALAIARHGTNLTEVKLISFMGCRLVPLTRLQTVVLQAALVGAPCGIKAEGKIRALVVKCYLQAEDQDVMLVAS